MRPVVIFLRWLALIAGCLSSGLALHLVHWLADWLWNWHPALAFVVGGAAVLGGPDALPPLTPCNGCESMTHRLFWCLILVVGPYFLVSSLGEEGTGTFGTMKGLWICSSIWHLLGGDDDSLRVCRFYAQHGIPQTEVRKREMNRDLLLPYYRVGAGIGMLWAVFGEYSARHFGFGILLVVFIITVPGVILPPLQRRNVRTRND